MNVSLLAWSVPAITVADRRGMEELWESLDEDRRDAIPLTSDQEAELARRLEAHEREGAVGISAEDLHEKLRRRSRDQIRLSARS